MTSTKHEEADDIEEPLLQKEPQPGNVQRSKSLHRPGSLQRRRWFQRPDTEASLPQAATDTVHPAGTQLSINFVETPYCSPGSCL